MTTMPFIHNGKPVEFTVHGEREFGGKFEETFDNYPDAVEYYDKMAANIAEIDWVELYDPIGMMHYHSNIDEW